MKYINLLIMILNVLVILFKIIILFSDYLCLVVYFNVTILITNSNNYYFITLLLVWVIFHI